MERCATVRPFAEVAVLPATDWMAASRSADMAPPPVDVVGEATAGTSATDGSVGTMAACASTGTGASAGTGAGAGSTGATATGAGADDRAMSGAGVGVGVGAGLGTGLGAGTGDGADDSRTERTNSGSGASSRFAVVANSGVEASSASDGTGAVCVAATCAGAVGAGDPSGATAGADARFGAMSGTGAGSGSAAPDRFVLTGSGVTASRGAGGSVGAVAPTGSEPDATLGAATAGGPLRSNALRDSDARRSFNDDGDSGADDTRLYRRGAVDLERPIGASAHHTT